VPAASPPTRIPSLDGLRSLAIGFVLLEHIGVTSFTGFDYFGAFGVQVFFVISGYLITRLLQTEQERTGQIDVVSFYVRRCFRILPAAFVFIAVMALFIPGARPDLPWALTYTMSYHPHHASSVFVHLWSLSVEEQFYLLWPVALVIGFRWRAQVAWGALVLGAVARLVVAPHSAWLAHFSFPCVMDSMAAGCLLAVYEPRLRRFQLAKRIGPGYPLFLVIPYVLALLLWRDSFPNQSGKSTFAPLWGIIPMLIALFVFLVVERPPRLLNNRAMDAVGALSYSLYLWQQPIIVRHHGPAWVALLTLLLFAGVSYFIVEEPMISLGRRLAQLRGRHGSQPHVGRFGELALSSQLGQ
jgi:peptidoglycan/LPS O-acetylase OafA/YrhL